MARTPTPSLADRFPAEEAQRQPEPAPRDRPADQALALIGLGLMRQLAVEGDVSSWIWAAGESGAAVDVPSLRQRLELVDLALRTAAPLTTAEVTHLLGTRPGAPVVERGGVVARRRGRNVWILSRLGGEASGTGAPHFQETPRRRF